MQGFLSGGQMTKPPGTRLTSLRGVPSQPWQEQRRPPPMFPGRPQHILHLFNTYLTRGRFGENYIHLNLKITLLNVSNEPLILNYYFSFVYMLNNSVKLWSKEELKGGHILFFKWGRSLLCGLFSKYKKGGFYSQNVWKVKITPLFIVKCRFQGTFYSQQARKLQDAQAEKLTS